ncbi:efflux RND transporter periplasmic adaptor subunit [Paenibacillus sp. N1-5-1-14]|uniref:efflux RND transporter periplasmic adaptor subunit n=1 Tax=Paenibacillus radicibacter TaxID=2972488 RepID=UPI002158B8E9|nr:efflux RND transporter periplasmic adaptor subunit [Paenibacillus radicibacter]MCR8642927.1 efflux RND transporter periplasmic adaptor subunit [Paenibacillus radicibacter]
MEIQHTEQTKFGRKRMIRTFAGWFIGLLIVFTLLSNTLMALTLPKVVVVESSRGQLLHTFQGSGVLKWMKEVALTNSTGWKVKRVDVKEGEVVKKGQKLVLYDSAEAEQQILDEQATLHKLTLTMEELQSSFIETAQGEDEKSLRSAKHVIEISKIDLEVQQRKIQKLKNHLTNNRELVAPFDGIITQINAINGLISSNGGADAHISNGSLGFEFLAPADIADLLKIGEKLDVQVNGNNVKQVEGQIADIQDANSIDTGSVGKGTTSNTPMKRILVTIQDESLKGGDRVQIELTKPTSADAILISNKAIHEDGSGKYIFKVEERNGPLGNTYHIRKVSIIVANSNEQQSAVTQGIFEREQVIVESSDPLQDGDKVRIH